MSSTPAESSSDVSPKKKPKLSFSKKFSGKGKSLGDESPSKGPEHTVKSTILSTSANNPNNTSYNPNESTLHGTMLDSSIATIPLNYNDVSRLNLNEEEDEFPLSPEPNITSSSMRNSKSMKNMKRPTNKSSLIEEDRKESITNENKDELPGSPSPSMGEDGTPGFIKRRKSIQILKESNSNADETLNPMTAILEDEEKQEKEKLKPRRVSKYTQMVNQTTDPDYEEKMRNLLKEYTTGGGNNIFQEVKKDQRLSLFHYSKK
jgi:hypothetical protein